MTTPLRWPRIHAWALYDFASTAFSMNIVSTYFALWAIKDQGASDLNVALAKSLSMLVVIMIAPMVGALSDRAGRRKPFLIGSTLVYVAGAIAIGLGNNLWLGLLFYGIGNIGFQLSSVFYNAMLPEISTPATMGRISGYGRMVGYIGSLVAVVLGAVFATGKFMGFDPPIEAGGSLATFIPTALLTLTASIPLLLLREAARPAAAPAPAPGGPADTLPSIAQAPHELPSIKSLIHDMRTDPSLKGVGAFMLGAFFFFDTINTIRDFMAVYLYKVVGLSETGGSLQSFLIVVVLCSLVGALMWGYMADKTTPKIALVGVLSLMALGFTGLVFISDKDIVMRVLAPMLGLAFGGVLVTTRPLLAQIVPTARQGEFFGLFVLANDAAAILGPLTWGVVVAALASYGAIAYQAALASQLMLLLVGLALILRVPDPAKRVSVPLPPGPDAGTAP